MDSYRSSRLIFKPLLSPWVALFAVLCLSVELLQHFQITISYFHYWANDLIAIPLILSLTVSLKRLLSRDKHFTLSSIQVIFVFIYVSVLFELILPAYSSKYTGDLVDISCYGLGTLFYQAVMNNQSIKHKDTFQPPFKKAKEL